jgi:hypothetical protein
VALEQPRPFGDDLEQLDGRAQNLLVDQSSDLWANFRAVEAAQFREVWGDLADDHLGVASNKRRVGPGFEIVVVTTLGEYTDGFMVHGPVALERAFPLLMCETAEGWLVGNHVGQALPYPSWPPAWWSADDPAAERWSRERRRR